jgi:pimeloyl-ACP methyl ester carboxylesterase
VETEGQFLDRGEGRIAFDVRGVGPLVVCVPGMGDVRFVYRHLERLLVAAGYRVAAMDLRGHGDSDATFRRYETVATGEDVLALIRHLGGPAVIIGNSMAAGAAVWAAAQEPSLVSGLVLIGPFVRNVPMHAAVVLAFRLALLRPWGPSAWLAYHRTLFRGRRPDDLGEHERRIRESLHRAGHWAAFKATTRTSHAPAEASLPAVHAPVLVVMGTDDPDFKNPAAEASWIADRLRGRLAMVPDAGHYPQAEYPDVVGASVLTLLAEVFGRAAG